MPLREISEFIPGGLVMISPGSCELDPAALVGLECHPDDRLVRLHFNASTIDLHFHHTKTDGGSLTHPDLYKVKNALWNATARPAPRTLGSVFNEAQRRHHEEEMDRAKVVKMSLRPEEARDIARDRAHATQRRIELESTMDAQKEEFNKLSALMGAFDALPAVVDDDYQEARHRYESVMCDFLDALAHNGRFARNGRWNPPSGTIFDHTTPPPGSAA